MGILAGGVALVMVALRIAVVGERNVGRLVLVGSRFLVPGGKPGVPVVTGNGYDGQFYFRLALAPFDFSTRAHGIQIDSAARFERIVYPVLAWVVALGRAQVVPWTLVAVNVIGLGLLGWMGAVLAREGAKHPAWGLLVPGYFGFVWSLSRDLTEIVEATFLVAGLLAVRRGRPVLAGLALSAAVLSRETALIAVGCLAVVGVIRWWRHGHGYPVEKTARAQPVAWLLPLAAFIGWQGVAGAELGHLPLAASGQHNLDLPFVGLARGASHYAPLLPSTASLLWFGELVVLGVVVVTAARTLKMTAAPVHERLAWVGFGVLTLCLAPGIWLGDVGFRSLDDLYVLSCLLLLASPLLARPPQAPPRRARLVAATVGVTWLIVAGELIKVI